MGYDPRRNADHSFASTFRSWLFAVCSGSLQLQSGVGNSECSVNVSVQARFCFGDCRFFLDKLNVPFFEFSFQSFFLSMSNSYRCPAMSFTNCKKKMHKLLKQRYTSARFVNFIIPLKKVRFFSRSLS